MKQRNILVLLSLILLILSSFSPNIDTIYASEIEERVTNYNKIINRIPSQSMVDGIKIFVYHDPNGVHTSYGSSTIKLNFESAPNNNVTFINPLFYNIASQLLIDNPDVFLMMPYITPISNGNMSAIKNWYNQGDKLIWLGGDNDYGGYVNMNDIANPLLEYLESDLRFFTGSIEDPFSNDFARAFTVLVNETGVTSPITNYVTSGFVHLPMHGPTAIAYVDSDQKYRDLRNSSLDSFENKINIILNSSKHAIALDSDLSLIESDLYAYNGYTGNYPMLVTQTMNNQSDNKKSLIVTSGEAIFSNYKNMNGFITERENLEHNGSRIITNIITYFFDQMVDKSYNIVNIKPTDQQFIMDENTYSYYDTSGFIGMTSPFFLSGNTHKDGFYFYIRNSKIYNNPTSQALILMQTDNIHSATSLTNEINLYTSNDIKFIDGFHPNIAIVLGVGGPEDNYVLDVMVYYIENESSSSIPSTDRYQQKIVLPYDHHGKQRELLKLFLPWDLFGANSFEDLRSNYNGAIKVAGLTYNETNILSSAPYNHNTTIQSYYSLSPYFDYPQFSNSPGYKLMPNSTVINPITLPTTEISTSTTEISTSTTETSTSTTETSTSTTNTTSPISYTTTYTGPETVTETVTETEYNSTIYTDHWSTYDTFTETTTQTQIINQTIIIKEINNNTIIDTLTIFSQNPELPILEFTQTVSIFIMYVVVKKLKNKSSFKMKSY